MVCPSFQHEYSVVQPIETLLNITLAQVWHATPFHHLLTYIQNHEAAETSESYEIITKMTCRFRSLLYSVQSVELQYMKMILDNQYYYHILDNKIVDI